MILFFQIYFGFAHFTFGPPPLIFHCHHELLILTLESGIKLCLLQRQSSDLLQKPYLSWRCLFQTIFTERRHRGQNRRPVPSAPKIAATLRSSSPNAASICSSVIASLPSFVASETTTSSKILIIFLLPLLYLFLFRPLQWHFRLQWLFINLPSL